MLADKINVETGYFITAYSLDDTSLVELFGWTKEEFDTGPAGSPIHRIGHEQWLRNLAEGLGNAPVFRKGDAALQGHRDDVSSLVREHVRWALHLHKEGV